VPAFPRYAGDFWPEWHRWVRFRRRLASDAGFAFVVFGLASITTIAAPVVVAVAAPERSAETLAKWRMWLVGNSRTIVLVMLMVIGAILMARGAYSLTA
jgi:hypothetical protein